MTTHYFSNFTCIFSLTTDMIACFQSPKIKVMLCSMGLFLALFFPLYKFFWASKSFKLPKISSPCIIWKSSSFYWISRDLKVLPGRNSEMFLCKNVLGVLEAEIFTFLLSLFSHHWNWRSLPNSFKKNLLIWKGNFHWAVFPIQRFAFIIKISIKFISSIYPTLN